MERLVTFFVLLVTLLAQFLQFSDSKCPPGQAALYKVTFQGLWSRKTFFKHYPLYRPPAQWSNIIGRTHGSKYYMFKPGRTASYEFKEFMETGHSHRMDKTPQGENSVRDIFVIPKISTGVGDGTSTIIADSTHSMVSIAAKLIPSPDWFVGLDSLDLCEEGEWLSKTTISLFPLDGGTQRGLIYSSPKWPERIPRVIQEIKTKAPNHPASSFFYPDKKTMPPIARLTVVRTQVYGGDGLSTGSGQEERRDEPVKTMPEVVTETIETLPPNKDCTVDEWSKWSVCSKTCGFGRRSRKRLVIKQPETGGIPCPPLAQNQMCGSMKSCSWSHFSASRWSTIKKTKPSRRKGSRRPRRRYGYKNVTP